VEQDRIVAYIEREIVALERPLPLIKAAIERVVERRSALITAAVTGQIDVRAYRSKERSRGVAV
jgi:type I restriction enzyme S subunit